MSRTNNGNIITQIVGVILNHTKSPIINKNAMKKSTSLASMKRPASAPFAEKQEKHVQIRAGPCISEARQARALVVRHPDILATASTFRAPFRGGKFMLENTNKDFLKGFDGADGLKTGYHKRAKFNIAATARRDGIRLIAVILGAESTKDRTREASRLLGHVFATYTRDTVMDEGERLPDRVYVEGSAHEYAPLQVAGDLSIFARRGDFARVRIVPTDVPVFEAPVAQGTPAGMIVAKLGDRELGRVPLVVAEPVERAPILWRVWHWRTPRPTRGRFLPAAPQVVGNL